MPDVVMKAAGSLVFSVGNKGGNAPAVVNVPAGPQGFPPPPLDGHRIISYIRDASTLGWVSCEGEHGLTVPTSITVTGNTLPAANGVHTATPVPGEPRIFRYTPSVLGTGFGGRWELT